MEQKGLLVVLSGPSGCGKGTVLKELLSRREDIFLSVSATTRSPRPGEVNGTHYYFLTKEQFQQEIDEDGMLEHACYCDNYYGTPKKPVEQRCARGENVILEIEVQGAMQVCKKLPEAVSIFILPPSIEELERRLVDRQTEDMETIRKRMAAAKEEMKLAKDYDYVVVNETVEQAAHDIEAILCAEKCRSDRRAEFVAQITQ